MKKRVLSFLIVTVFLVCTGLGAAAHEVPDLEKNGTITFTVDYEKEPVDGGSLTLYRVGDIVINDGDYSFKLIEKLDKKQSEVEDPEDSQLARNLAAKAVEAKLNGITASIKNGEAVFDDVKPGLYVVVQHEASDGFEAMSPFLISMPKFENGVYVTDVKADPKPSLEKEPEKPTKPADPTLPQTGQLNWPVPVMAVSGLVLFVMGWMLYFKRKREI